MPSSEIDNIIFVKKCLLLEFIKRQKYKDIFANKRENRFYKTVLVINYSALDFCEQTTTSRQVLLRIVHMFVDCYANKSLTLFYVQVLNNFLIVIVWGVIITMISKPLLAILYAFSTIIFMLILFLHSRQ